MEDVLVQVIAHKEPILGVDHVYLTCLVKMVKFGIMKLLIVYALRVLNGMGISVYHVRMERLGIHLKDVNVQLVTSFQVHFVRRLIKVDVC